MTTKMTGPEYTKTDDDLKWYARDYLSRCESKMYRRLRRDGELGDYLQLLANSARSYAETLISQGVFAPQAWHWAIRERILGVERD